MSKNNLIKDTMSEDAQPSVEQVIDYLRCHPDFLTRADVIDVISPPGRWSDKGEGVIDMQQFMMERFREDIDNLRDCAQDLIDTSRSNMSNQTRTHAATLALMGAVDFDHLLRVVNEDLPLLLDIDAASICFEPPAKPSPHLVSPHIRRLPAGAVDHFLGSGQDVLLLQQMNDDGTLFGGASSLVRSAAVARLHPDLRTPAGLLALGGRGSVFHAGQGTELICFLARVVERCVHRWQERAA